MRTRIDEIAPEIYRISSYEEGYPVNFGLFLINAERPAMVETGLPQLFEDVRGKVAEVVDPSRLAYIAIPHYEADECGSLNDFLRIAPQAEPLASPVGTVVTVTPFAARPPRMVKDGETLDLGGKRLRFLITPWVHFWDSMLVFEETTGTLFSSDLFMQGGDGPAETEEDVSDAVVGMARGVGLLPAPRLLHRALGAIEALPVRTLATHHGSVLKGDLTRYYRAMRRDGVADIVDVPFYTAPTPV